MFHGTSRFIDELCTVNDDAEFSSSYRYIYPKQLELKLEHKGEHAISLDLDITFGNNIFVYKLFDKRDKFPLKYSIINVLWFNVFRVPANSSM